MVRPRLRIIFRAFTSQSCLHTFKNCMRFFDRCVRIDENARRVIPH